MKNRLSVIALTLVLIPAVSAASDGRWVRGDVVNVTGQELRLAAGDESLTIRIAPTTKIIAPKAGRQARALQANGEPVTAPTFLHADDRVKVFYREVDGVKIADSIRVTRQALSHR
jgi:hypothetical protein